MDLLPQRLVETQITLPILFAAPGPITVCLTGSTSAPLQAEALRWREVAAVHLLGSPAEVKDRRLVAAAPRPGTCHLVICSLVQDPTPFYPLLTRNGVIAASTLDATKWAALRTSMAANTGNAVPWRAFTPSPVYGVVAGASKPMRGRTVPKGCQYLTQNFLPSLFTFSKDEMPLAFGGN